MTFSLTVCDDNGKQVSGVYNAKAFECLVCDLDIWYECSAEISGYLHEKYNELLLSDWHNVKLFHGLKMLKRILYSQRAAHSRSPNNQNTHYQMCALGPSGDIFHFVASLVADTQEQQTSHMIELRERLLDIVDELIAQQTTNKTYNFQEEIVKVLLFDLFVLFMNRWSIEQNENEQIFYFAQKKVHVIKKSKVLKSGLGLDLRLVTLKQLCLAYIFGTVEPPYNEPPYNEILLITNKNPGTDFL
ncbi:WD repeat and FYVE domain-containing [Brachionus plicatilis]|uniref:WD repeat and FYVE domain-containing n=1 Tax=Brachionus plicatilis TaxID=10195 RepID=A0A3M7RKR6_BRAPC|nr:WD repeat and FYVE domain-containing [Brachionus plicatilis]